MRCHPPGACLHDATRAKRASLLPAVAAASHLDPHASVRAGRKVRPPDCWRCGMLRQRSRARGLVVPEVRRELSRHRPSPETDTTPRRVPGGKRAPAPGGGRGKGHRCGSDPRAHAPRRPRPAAARAQLQGPRVCARGPACPPGRPGPARPGAPGQGRAALTHPGCVCGSPRDSIAVGRALPPLGPGSLLRLRPAPLPLPFRRARQSPSGLSRKSRPRRLRLGLPPPLGGATERRRAFGLRGACDVAQGSVMMSEGRWMPEGPGKLSLRSDGITAKPWCHCEATMSLWSDDVIVKRLCHCETMM